MMRDHEFDSHKDENERRRECRREGEQLISMSCCGGEGGSLFLTGTLCLVCRPLRGWVFVVDISGW